MRIGAMLTACVGLAVAGGSAWFARDVLEARLARECGAPGTFCAAEDLLPAGNGPTRRGRRPISQGELILTSKVPDFGEKVTIVQTLGANNRAMAIKVNAETGVGGFVTPGDFVDVLLTQGQGQRLALAQKAGTLSLTLRTLEGAVDEPLEPIRLSDLMQDLSPVPEDEAFDMLQAMNTGHDGAMTTLHANSARDALGRIEQMVTMIGMEFPMSAIRSQIASGLDFVVQLARLSDGRRPVARRRPTARLKGHPVVTAGRQAPP